MKKTAKSDLLNVKETNLKGWFNTGFSKAIGVARKVILLFFVLFAFQSISIAQSTVPQKVERAIHKDKKELRQDRAALDAQKDEVHQIKELSDIPQVTMNKFQAQFPKATNVEWSVPDNMIRADYSVGTSNRVAFYNWNNELVGHGRFLAYANLPEKAKKTISKKYVGYQPMQTIWYDNNEDNDDIVYMWGYPFSEDSYFTQLKKGNKTIVLKVGDDGFVTDWSAL